MRPCLRLSLALVLTLSTVAALGQTPKVYVVDFPGFQGQVPELISEQVTKVVRDRMDADPTVNLLPRLGGGGVSPAILEATRLYEVGRSQLVDQNFAESIRNFEGALAFLESNIADIADWNMVEEIFFSLATAHFAAGDTDAAKTYIQRLVAFRPAFEPTSNEETSKEFIALFNETRDRQIKRKGDLDTSAVPTQGAEIWIDGSVRGATPMSIEDLTEGTHFLVLRQGDTRYSGLFTVKKRKTHKVEASLAPASANAPDQRLTDILVSGKIGPDAAAAARDLASRTAAGYIVSATITPMSDGYEVLPFIYANEVATLRRLEPVTFDKDLLNVNVDGYALTRDIIDAIYDPSAGVVIDENTVCDASPEGIAELKGVESSGGGGINIGNGGGVGDGNGNGNGGDIITNPIEGGDEENWYENPWVWTGIVGGLAVIGGGVALALILTADEPASGFNATIQW